MIYGYANDHYQGHWPAKVAQFVQTAMRWRLRKLQLFRGARAAFVGPFGKRISGPWFESPPPSQRSAPR